MLVKRVRTWLFIASIMAALLGPISVVYINRILDSQFQTNNPIQFQPTPVDGNPKSSGQEECIPGIDQATFTNLDLLVVSQNDEPVISIRMAAIFAADQAARQNPYGGNLLSINEEDRERRIEVFGYIEQGQIHSPQNLVYAAYIFQHGDCPEHYLLGNRLAESAMQAGYPDAKWIYAATLDRYLMSLGEDQKYGTQYTWIDGEFQLYPVDPTTTDTERANYNVLPLGDTMRQTPEGMGGQAVQQKWLETWWLTLIGAAFAVLNAIIGILDPKMNARRGQILLAISIAVYLVSVVGHYTQMMALSQGNIEMQGNIWNLVDGMMILIWLACAFFEVFRVRKKT
jgi:hypothetical protein